MYQRNHSYDGTTTQLKNLAGLLIKKEGLLKKSKDNNELGLHIHEVSDTYKEADVVCQDINKSFVDLQADWLGGKLPQSRYVDYLKNFKEFLVDTEIKKGDLPDSLNAAPILAEIEKYFIMPKGSVSPKWKTEPVNNLLVKGGAGNQGKVINKRNTTVNLPAPTFKALDELNEWGDRIKKAGKFVP